ncbi:MAG: metallophosphoesterase [Bacilli bacterium]
MKKIIIFLIVLLIGILLYAHFIETKNFKITEQSIQANISESFNGFKIVQFSDLLIASTKTIDDLEEIVNEINNLKPDIIVFTGDLIKKDYDIKDNEIEKIKELLKNLNCTLYKYATIGDNDQENYKEIMTDSDFIILDNESNYIFYQDITPIKITGITDVSDLEKALSISDDLDASYNIVITHQPDNIEILATYDIDLVLAGHSLLGQIRLPFIGGIIKKDGATKYIDNYYKVNDTIMYVSSGLGIDNNYYFRLFNKPEINLYRLTQK